MNPVSAILLAAGRSERMGAFKPLLPFGNSTVIETCVDSLRKGGIDKLIIVVGHRAEEIRERLKYSEVDFVLNPDLDSEMKESIGCGVRQLPDAAKATLIAPVDHPAFSPTVVERLIAEWEKGAHLVVPTWQGRGGHPVLVDLGLREELLNLDASDGLKSLFETNRSRVKRVPVNSPFIARDIDTWDDYRDLHHDYFGVPPPI